MWLPVGKNVMRRQGDGAQDGRREDGPTRPVGGSWLRWCWALWVWPGGQEEREGERLCVETHIQRKKKQDRNILPKSQRNQDKKPADGTMSPFNIL